MKMLYLFEIQWGIGELSYLKEKWIIDNRKPLSAILYVLGLKFKDV